MPTNNKLQVVYKNIDDLIPYARNSKIHDETNVNLIAGSIKSFGFNNPVLLDGENGIIAGHGRVLAAKKLGYKEVPCIELNGMTEAEKRAYIIADNRLTEKSEWDKEILSLELQDLSTLGIDLNTIGFDEKDLGALIPEQVPQEDEGPGEPPVEPKTVKGDVWYLGEHRLMCGDSTSENDVKALMQDEKADLVFTDPPYKLETEGGCTGEIGKRLRKQGGDIDFISDFDPTNFLNVLPLAFESGHFNAYIFCNKELLPIYLNWAVENKLAFNVLIWKKPSAIPIGDSHRPDIEYLLFFRKNAIWHNALKGVNYSRCLEFGRESGLHPTMKPVGLIGNELQISSNKDSVILDCFGGSGSTLIACEQLGRKARLMELDEHYCDVALQRWQKLTGKEAVRADGVKFNSL